MIAKTRAWTLGDQLAATGNRPAGFDYMRLILSLLIIVWHSIVTCYGRDAQSAAFASPARPFVLIMLPMFFALSGFLVAGSLERSKAISTFIGLRALRILPALTMDTLFSALILGALLTTLPLREYFAHPMFHAYFWNILGEIHYTLPGVFEQNPAHPVNGQLFTIPFELACYALLSILAVVGLFKSRVLFLVITLVMTAALGGFETLTGDQQMGVSGKALVLSFLSGASIYQFRDMLPWTQRWGFLALGLTVLCLSWRPLIYYVGFPAAYFTVFVGLFNPRKFWLLDKGDYSYGLFLYGFPIQQALVALVPAARHWYFQVPMAIPLAFAMAAISWHVFEKPALAQKKHLYTFEPGWIAFWAGMRQRVGLIPATAQQSV